MVGMSLSKKWELLEKVRISGKTERQKIHDYIEILTDKIERVKSKSQPGKIGKMFEYRVRDMFLNIPNTKCDRIPSSGSSHGFKDDLVVSMPMLKFRVECKKTTGHSIVTQYDWFKDLKEHCSPIEIPLVIIGFDNSPAYVCMPFDTWVGLLLKSPTKQPKLYDFVMTEPKPKETTQEVIPSQP